MPFCPFCRKSVEANTVWCSCGTNLCKYPNLPASTKDIKNWLVENEPKTLKARGSNNSSLLADAKKQLIKEQEEQIAKETQDRVEIAEAEKLISDFLADCRTENLDPTIDIGQLRRERWKQWKRIPKEYRRRPPLKEFSVTPGYLFEAQVAKFKLEFCVSIDGELYKHQLNARDPYPIEELLSMVPLKTLAQALTTTLVWLLKGRQKPVTEEPAPEVSPPPKTAAKKQKAAENEKSEADAERPVEKTTS